jgi:hypothetical protein
MAGAHYLRQKQGCGARYFRLNARFSRWTRDRAVQRIIIETEWLLEGRRPIVGIHRLLIAAGLLLSELFGPVALVSLDLAR